MNFTKPSLKPGHSSADTSRVGKNHARGNTMKFAVAVIALGAAMWTPATALAESTDTTVVRRTAEAVRSLTGQHVRRCKSTAYDANATTEQAEYACNPTGADACTITSDGEEACRVVKILESARRVYLHPEDYKTLRDGQRKTDLLRVAMWSEYGADTELPPVGDVPAAKPKPKPVWKCPKKKKGQKRKPKCYKVKSKSTKPATTAPTPPPAAVDEPATDPHHDAAKAYADRVWSLVSGCQRTSLTYDEIVTKYAGSKYWTSPCTLIFYDKLKGFTDTFNAQNPNFATPYPSRLVVQQVENVYLKDAGTDAERANLQCWLDWGNSTTKPLPTGCQG